MNDTFLAQFATLGPLGHLKASGTVGSLVALLAGSVVTITWGVGALLLFVIVATILGYHSANAHFRLTGEKDSGSVIIDEVAGQWLVLLVIPVPAALSTEYLIMLFLAFALFRFFDIIKLGPVKKAESLPGGAGVMADDILAGILAGLTINLMALAF